MPSLDDDFRQLAERLSESAPLAASRSDPFYYFVYPPAQALEVKRRIPVWTAQLRDRGLAVERISFSDLVWELVEQAGWWQTWLEAEAGTALDLVNESVRDVLRTGDAIVSRVADHLQQQRHGTIVFLTETEMLHPYFRVRTIETALHDGVTVPTVVFYPGRRSGQFGLHFLGFYPEDGNYRATLTGGQV
jgi:Domain of unknown function (DUF1788)